MPIEPPTVNGGFVFVDESKAKGYALVATMVDPRRLPEARREIRRLILPGQQRIHMKKESDSRRRKLLSVIDSLGVETVIYHADSSGTPEVVCRNRCIDALVRDAVQRKTLEITFETDERIVSRDQRQVATTLRKIGLVDGLAYRHLPAASEALLIIPDAIGWAWMRGGDWRRRCSRVTVVNVE